MATERTPRSLTSLHWLEAAAWTLGTLLMATYAGTRWWYAHASDRGVAAFEVARIDMSTWSNERVERYREAVSSAAVPQALLRIPSVKLVVPVFDGTSDQNLNRGAGRIEGTAQIGAPGNVGIAAHRDGFFRVLKDIRIGDELLLESHASSEVYRIVATTIVDPSDVSVLDPTLISTVTLVTCYPFYYVGSAPRRFIVHAQLVSPQKAPAG
jgi:sortase A